MIKEIICSSLTEEEERGDMRCDNEEITIRIRFFV